MVGRLRVDLDALARNYGIFCRSSAGDSARSEVGAVVKANAYGFGVERVAQKLAEAGAGSFFVATASEGVALRAILPDSLIYVFEGPSTESALELEAAGLIPVLNHPGQLEVWRSRRRLPAAIHVDTGMARLGFSADVPSPEGFNITLLMTHLACADEPDHSLNAQQIARFEKVAARFPDVPTSIGNSAGWLLGEPYQGNVGRPGIGLYGGNPFAHRENPMNPVATLEGQVLQVRTLAAGETVGYGSTFKAASERQIAVVGVGYADGIPRVLSNTGEMAVAGVRCRMVGRISMDATMIDVTDLQSELAVGDWVECFGNTVSVDEFARRAGTLSYEVFTNLGSRVERQYH